MAAPPEKPRVFLDANILLAGSAFARWPYEILEHATDGDFRLVLSPLVIKQARRHLERRYPQGLGRFERFLRETDYEMIPDPIRQEVDANSNLVRDASDVPVALAAIAADVDYLVSEDKDLTEQNETTAELHGRVKVLISGTFLREVMGWTSAQLEAVRHRTWDDVAETVS